jgi:biotin-(acetyl-CoA carboxylase) ligase
MADAAEEIGGLPDRAIRLKWPNDLVIETADGAVPLAPAVATEVRKVAGVLGESSGLGTDDPRVIVGIGLNTDWPPDGFPPALRDSITSLRAASHGRRIDHDALLDGFLARIEVRLEALRGGRFDVADWRDRQLTTGRDVELIAPDGASSEIARAVGVDANSGALVLADDRAPDRERHVLVGEIRHVRLAATGQSVPTRV